jgi:glyoxylase-like metal-dependent hydrolase (beta-lactamase superfamily II)
MRNRDAAELNEAKQRMPIAVPECAGVYHCGFHSENSFGATSYLITRPEGNILMDSPRFNPFLAKQLESLGGVKYIVLSHMRVSLSFFFRTLFVCL